MFHDRDEAAVRLADKLKSYQGKNPLILAIPRGAVPMAKIIADKLDGEFDVVLVRKLRAPDYAELAVGSVDESGPSMQTRLALMMHTLRLKSRRKW